MEPSDQDTPHVGPNVGSHVGPNAFDQLTIECMANRRLYKQCLKQTNATKYQETEEAALVVRRFRHAFTEMTERVLDDFCSSYDSHRYNTKVNAAFVQYLQTCLEYHQQQQWEQEGEQDMLFPPEPLSSEASEASEASKASGANRWNTTAWGKLISKEE